MRYYDVVKNIYSNKYNTVLKKLYLINIGRSLENCIGFKRSKLPNAMYNIICFI